MTAAHSDEQGPRLRDLVAEEVRVVLARNRISGAELARRLGRSQTFVAKRLDGRQAFDIDDLEAVAAVLSVPVARFFPHEPDPANSPVAVRAIPRSLTDSAGPVADGPQVGSLIRFPIERRACHSGNDTTAIRQQG